MEFTEKVNEAIEEFLTSADAEQVQNSAKMGESYWPTLVSTIDDQLYSNKDILAFIRAERLGIDFGLFATLCKETSTIAQSIEADTGEYGTVNVTLFSTWLSELIGKIFQGDKKEMLEKDTARLRVEKKELMKRLHELQNGRRELLRQEFEGGESKAMLQIVEQLDQTDDLVLRNLQMKREVARGKFIPIEQRREYAKSNQQQARDATRNDTLYSRIRSPELRKQMKSISNQIAQLHQDYISCSESIQAKDDELRTIKTSAQKLSREEIQARVRTELEYIRDIVKLSARRLHIESCSILTSKEKYFTIQEVRRCYFRMLEFDPRVFCNSKVQFLGKPSMLLVPGNGNTLFDWKNNQFIIPLMPHNGDFLASIATGFIEYRLDTDEEKTFIASYQKLAEYRDIKSYVTIRANLIRDYIKWMTAEYGGFKVLSKEVRGWFEREIAPKKNELFCTPSMHHYELDNKTIQEYENALKDKSSKGETLTPDDFWVAHILAYHQGRMEESLNYCRQLIALKPDHTFAYFNLGIVANDLKHKQDAIAAFREFIKRSGRTWWSGVATEHVLRLQM